MRTGFGASAAVPGRDATCTATETARRDTRRRNMHTTRSDAEGRFVAVVGRLVMPLACTIVVPFFFFAASRCAALNKSTVRPARTICSWISLRVLVAVDGRSSVSDSYMARLRGKSAACGFQ